MKGSYDPEAEYWHTRRPKPVAADGFKAEPLAVKCSRCGATENEHMIAALVGGEIQRFCKKCGRERFPRKGKLR